jgi:mono/diheme cytochrome c family protein
MADDALVGQLHASNLTSGVGGITHYDDLELARAIRDGIAPDGRSLLLMPSQYLHSLTDDDLGAIIAWLRTAEPIDSERPPTHAGPLTRFALVTGLAPELIAAEPAASSRSRSADEDESFGAYLVDLASCRVCHHADLAGGLHPLSLPGEPPPPDLTRSGPLKSWSFDDFEQAMRTGVNPDGRTLSPEYMPWPHFAGMTDDELGAIWHYLKTLPPAR